MFVDCPMPSLCPAEPTIPSAPPSRVSACDVAGRVVIRHDRPGFAFVCRRRGDEVVPVAGVERYDLAMRRYYAMTGRGK